MPGFNYVMYSSKEYCNKQLLDTHHMVHMDRHKFKPYLNSCELLTEFVVLKNELPRIAYNLDYEYSYITYQFPTRTSI